MGGSAPEDEPSAISPPARLTGAPALRLHLTLAAGLGICIAAFVIEVLRATGGNTLSWVYVFEWPGLAGFSVYMWWNLLHERHGGERRHARHDPAPVERDKEFDVKLEAWNRYLRRLDDSASPE